MQASFLDAVLWSSFKWQAAARVLHAMWKERQLLFAEYLEVAKATGTPSWISEGVHLRPCHAHTCIPLGSYLPMSAAAICHFKAVCPCGIQMLNTPSFQSSAALALLRGHSLLSAHVQCSYDCTPSDHRPALCLDLKWLIYEPHGAEAHK